MDKIYQKTISYLKNPAVGQYDGIIVKSLSCNSKTLCRLNKPAWTCRPDIARGGFTLIELLVVVLIIGVLASIALPMYERAVWRSHFSRAISVTEPFYQAQLTYKMANGRYSPDLYSLSITPPARFSHIAIQSSDGKNVCSLGDPKERTYLALSTSSCEGEDYVPGYISTSTRQGLWYKRYLANGKRYCGACGDDKVKKFCQHITGNTQGRKWGGCMEYEFIR